MSTSPVDLRPRTRRRSRWISAAIAVGVVFALGATGCTPPPPAPPVPLSPMTIGVTHGIGVRQITFVDATRRTAAYGSYPGSPSRQLPTTIWYPSDGGGPFPLVVFAHGYDVTPSFYASLLPRLAAAGYVVAAPTYPLLSGQPAGPTDTVGWEDLFADTWFVTSRVLDLSAGGDAALGGLIDPARIAVAGHSDGAAVAFGDGYQPFRLDQRVRAVVSYAADLSVLGPYQPNGRPILHVLSDHDEYNPYDQSIGWDRAFLQTPKYTVTLRNATHAGPYTNPADPHFELLVGVTIAFLDTTLKAHPETMFFAALGIGAQPSLAALE
jgi:dienelactone hydrolase